MYNTQEAQGIGLPQRGYSSNHISPKPEEKPYSRLKQVTIATIVTAGLLLPTEALNADPYTPVLEIKTGTIVVNTGTRKIHFMPECLEAYKNLFEQAHHNKLRSKAPTGTDITSRF